ncbi:uncharacterized protein LAESUDRAFT_661564 [Laetiporus sulphureus 93-53]|uniref:Uncharacterized protein n=1 Tax=Laetiporus sulphureus 93-53 TaxID=1314785 RepID=A0A165CCI1_9APHY|nr:uncharacterized protein LAESUDRAFT_661564 [Laetiporus sulphureus 93-53]KZT02562.1 hypothetical protein LAESUDRAFT_661564 [Laetiporus sulphureus 93-53]
MPHWTTFLTLPPHFYATTDEDLNALFLGLGFKQAELAGMRAEYDKRMNAMLAQGGGKISVIGAKPVPGEHIHIILIPNDDNLAIRLWDGGLEDDSIFLFDFIDMRTKKAVNSPVGYEVHAFPNRYHMLNMPGPIISWEAAQNIQRKHIKPGEERFSVPEGTPCALHRHGQEVFMFAAPERPRKQSIHGVQLATARDAMW